MSKINVCILYGGKSAEHEVSLLSATNVVRSLDKEKYNIILTGIDKDGKWYLKSTPDELTHPDQLSLEDLTGASEVTLLPERKYLMKVHSPEEKINIDVVLPIMHGPHGEDGSMQGYLEIIDLPYVGCNVLGAAIGMDKDVMKRLLRDAGLPIGKFEVIHKHDQNTTTYKDMVSSLGEPMFIKPANLGSSVGVSKVTNAQEFEDALEKAFEFDTKAICEEFILGREVECAVLGNNNPQASTIGEIITNPGHDFYSYEAKYMDETGALLVIPAEVEPEKMVELQGLAIEVFKCLELRGLARVDFFLTAEGRILINEPNTLPGFTNISMYPRLWQASGKSYTQLLDELIALAIEDHYSKQQIKHSS